MSDDYTRKQRRLAKRTLNRLLKGVGDKRWLRFFRMGLTFCLHRGLTDEEIAGLPDWWHACPAVHIAGGPVEVFKSKGCEGVLSAEPCENLDREYIDDKMWLPVECGYCPPCLARTAARWS